MSNWTTGLLYSAGAAGLLAGTWWAWKSSRNIREIDQQLSAQEKILSAQEKIVEENQDNLKDVDFHLADAFGEISENRSNVVKNGLKVKKTLVRVREVEEMEEELRRDMKARFNAQEARIIALLDKLALLEEELDLIRFQARRSGPPECLYS